MTKKILIVEDNKKYAALYKQWTKEAGHEVIEAETMQKGLELVVSQKPDAVITDLGLKEGNGNTLAEQVHAQNPDLRIAGITGDNATTFDKRYISAAETKEIKQPKFRELLDYLLKNTNEYKTQHDSDIESLAIKEIVVATNILFQGYYFAKAIREKRKEIATAKRIIISSADMSRLLTEGLLKRNTDDEKKVFNMFETGELDAKKVYESSCILNPSLRTDKRYNDIMKRLQNRDYSFSVEDAIYAADKLAEKL